MSKSNTCRSPHTQTPTELPRYFIIELVIPVYDIDLELSWYAMRRDARGSRHSARLWRQVHSRSVGWGHHRRRYLVFLDLDSLGLAFVALRVAPVRFHPARNQGIGTAT